MACDLKPADQRLLIAGQLAGVLFCGVAIYGIMTRPGFDLQRHAVSNLSLGEGGWTMVSAFIASGIMTLLCAVGLSRILTDGRGRRALPILIGLYGLGLVIAGIFPAPACCGFPPGAPDNQLPLMTPTAVLHSIAFVVAFSSLIAACFVAALRFSGGSSLPSLLSGICMPLLVVLGMSGAIAPGVAFFIAAIIGWLWLAIVVMQLAGQSVRSVEPALAPQS